MAESNGLSFAQRAVYFSSVFLGIFIILSVILVNIGGVSGDTSPTPALANSQFDLLRINAGSIIYHFYLNRLCTEDRTSHKGFCTGHGTLGNHNWAVGDSQFSGFKNTNFIVSFIFLLFAAIFTLPMLGASWAAATTGQVARNLGLFSAIAISLCLLIGAATITGQMLHLKSEIMGLGVSNVQLASITQGLMWAAWIASILIIVLWVIGAKSNTIVTHDEHEHEKGAVHDAAPVQQQQQHEQQQQYQAGTHESMATHDPTTPQFHTAPEHQMSGANNLQFVNEQPQQQAATQGITHQQGHQV